MLEQLGRSYTGVKIEFKTLEDLDTIVNVAGANMAMARFILSVNFNPLTTDETKTSTPRSAKS